MKVGDLASGPGSGHFESWGFGVGHLDRDILKVGDLVSGHFGKLGIWIGPFLKLGIFMVKKSWGLRKFFS